MLFSGTHELERVWLDAMASAPAHAGPLDMVTAGLDPVAAMFIERHAFARLRAEIIGANPELQERELIKLHNLAVAIEASLRDCGVAAITATLAAEAGVTVFHVAFAAWLQQDDPNAFRRMMDASLDELRAITTATTTVMPKPVRAPVSPRRRR